MRLLHPTDFSPAAGSALELARDIRARLSGTLHLVHVQQRFEEGVDGSGARAHLDTVNPQLMRWQEEARAQEVKHLRAMVANLANPDGTSELRWGNPLRELLEMQAHYDLIVMGAHGSNRFDDFFLGGLAERLVRRSRRPVITVREENRAKRVGRVLVATDFSEPASNAYAFCRKLAAAGVKLVLCHIIGEPRDYEDSDYVSQATERLAQLSKGSAERQLIRQGDPNKVLPKLAEEVGADLIAIGLKHQRSAVGLLLGRRADALIRSSPVPILSVPLASD